MADGGKWPQAVMCPLTDLNRSLTVTSFFSGCGGLDLGFIGGFKFHGKRYQRTGFRVHAAYDLDEASIRTYKMNLGEHAQVVDLASVEMTKVPEADVLLGGFPCQEFSNCGPRKGLESPRGSLYRAMVNYASRHKPRLVVAENVAGILSLNDGADLTRIKSDFSAVGYKCITWEFRAEQFGVPQRRHRVFFIFVRGDLVGEPDYPVMPRGPVMTVKDAIGDLVDMESGRVQNQEQFFRAARAPNGHGQGDEVSPADAPGYTVRANSRSRVQFHYLLPRRLTVRECARLQTFPDDFSFPFTATVNMRMIGNAVPPVLAHAVAKSLSKFIRSCDHGEVKER